MGALPAGLAFWDSDWEWRLCMPQSQLADDLNLDSFAMCFCCGSVKNPVSGTRTSEARNALEAWAAWQVRAGIVQRWYLRGPLN
eukprot:6484426-Amphidinium_carterae.1